MLTAAVRHGMALAILCCSAAACGRKAKPADAADAPAVVKLPPLVLPSDTTKPDTMQARAEKVQAARTVLAQNYALLGAAIVFGDRRTIASMYAPEAILATPDSTYRGPVGIANALAAIGPPKSLRDFRRTSLTFRLVDSTVVDSGTYVAVSARKGADSVVERGSYLARWRMHPPPMNWALTNDRLFHPAKKAKGG
jgi:hypothetical protein